jgi:hypothetical protein
MTEDKKQEMEVWAPAQPFEGTNLIPVLRQPTDMVTAPGGLVGRENTEATDLILPSLQLLQGMSDPVTDQVEGAQPGKFFLSTSGEVLQPPLRVLIVHHSRSRAMFPQEDDPRTKGLESCVARDAMTGTVYGACDACPHKEWGQGRNDKPGCSVSHNFVAMTDRGPAVLRMSKSSFKNAKLFITNWMTSFKNLWAHPVVVGVKRKTKTLPNGKEAAYFIMDMRWDQREDVPPAFQETAKEFYDQIQVAHEEGRFGSDDDENSNAH